MGSWRLLYAIATTGAISLVAILALKLRNESFASMEEMRELRLRAELRKEMLERRNAGKYSELEKVLNEMVQHESMQENLLWEGAQEIYDEDEIDTKRVGRGRQSV